MLSTNAELNHPLTSNKDLLLTVCFCDLFLVKIYAISFFTAKMTKKNFIRKK